MTSPVKEMEAVWSEPDKGAILTAEQLEELVPWYIANILTDLDSKIAEPFTKEDEKHFRMAGMIEEWVESLDVYHVETTRINVGMTSQQGEEPKQEDKFIEMSYETKLDLIVDDPCAIGYLRSYTNPEHPDWVLDQ
jgi:hypothetical protein